MQYEAVIGLEIHVQIKTRTKMFTAAPYHYGAEPNTLTDAVVLGLPGTLPVLNHTAIEKCASRARSDCDARLGRHGSAWAARLAAEALSFKESR